MDGLVLNFDAGEDAGLIRAGDGKRYSFQSADWKSASPPRIGDVVDFEVEEGRATEIYLVRSDAPVVAPDPQASIPHPAADIPSAPPEAAYAFRGSAVPLAFAALIPLSFFLPWYSVPGWSISFWDLLTSMSLADLLPGRSTGLSPLFTYLTCAVPVWAAWLIFQELRGSSTPQLRVSVGAAGLAGAVVNLLTVWHFASYFASQSGSTVNVSSILSVFGIGWIMLIFLSVGLIAVGRAWPPFSNEENGQPDSTPDTYGAYDSGTFQRAQEESWAEDVFAKEERVRRNALLTRLGIGAQVVAVLCCILPWVIFSYATRHVGTASGIDLITGHQFVAQDPMGGIAGRFATGSAVAVILAILLIAVSLILALAWDGRKRAFAQVLGCGGAAALLLVEMFILLPGSLTGQAAQLGSGPSASSFGQVAPIPLQTGPNGGFWLTLIALGVGIVVNWMVLGDKDEPAE